MAISGAPREASAQATQRPSPWTLLALLGMTLLSFALHLYHIEAKSLWWDESLSLYRAQQDLVTVLRNRIDFPGIYTTDQHPPLYFVLLHVLIRLAGERDLVLRLPSAAFGTLLVPLLYALGKRLRHARVGLLAALLGALSPFYLWYAQEARMYTMVAALGTLALYALWRALVAHDGRWGLVSLLTSCLAATTQYLYVLTLLPQAFLVALLWRHGPEHRVAKHETRRRLWPALGGAVLVVVLALLSRQVGRLIPSLGNYRSYVPLPIMLRDILNSFSLGLSVNLRQAWSLDLFFLAVFGVGVYSLWRDVPPIPQEHARRRARGAGMMLLLGYNLIPVVLLWLFSFFVPIYTNSRYAITSSPAFYLGVALGLDALWRWRPLAWILAAVLVIAMGYSNYRYFYLARYASKEEYRAAAHLIARNERPLDVVIVNGPESIPAFRHYYSGDTPVIGMPEGGWRSPEIEACLRALSHDYARIWLLRARTALSDPDHRVRQWLEEHALQLMHKGYPSSGYYLSVVAYRPKSPLESLAETPSPLYILQEENGTDRLALLDYAVHAVDADGALKSVVVPPGMADEAVEQGTPLPAMPGKLLLVAMRWRPESELGDYKTSLRLVRDGLLWAQRDRMPYMYLPTSRWPRDRAVRHEADLPVPYGTPPGEYVLQLWVYEAQSGRSLLVRDMATGEVRPFLPLARIAVGRSTLPIPSPNDEIPPLAAKAVFGNALELLGVRLGATTVAPGDTLLLELYWRARREMSQDYQLVVNWEDADGEVWHVSTYPPSGTAYATSTWSADEVVRALVPLHVPPDALVGRHTLHLLIYAPDEGAFLWLRRGLIPWYGHNWPLGEITIARE